MISRAVLMGSVLLAIPASAQDDVALKSAVVTLSAEPALRAELEDGLVEKRASIPTTQLRVMISSPTSTIWTIATSPNG